MIDGTRRLAPDNIEVSKYVSGGGLIDALVSTVYDTTRPLPADLTAFKKR